MWRFLCISLPWCPALCHSLSPAAPAILLRLSALESPCIFSGIACLCPWVSSPSHLTLTSILHLVAIPSLCSHQYALASVSILASSSHYFAALPFAVICLPFSSVCPRSFPPLYLASSCLPSAVPPPRHPRLSVFAAPVHTVALSLSDHPAVCSIAARLMPLLSLLSHLSALVDSIQVHYAHPNQD